MLSKAFDRKFRDQIESKIYDKIEDNFMECRRPCNLIKLQINFGFEGEYKDFWFDLVWWLFA